MRLSSSGLVIAALVATGCQEAPSYAVRWSIAPREGAEVPQTGQPQDEEMTNPSVCTRSGVSQVQVWVIDELNRLADLSVRPCFPERFRRPGGAVRGATLQPGEYTAFVVGTRATGAPWGECPEYEDLPDGGDTDDGPFLPEAPTSGGDETTGGDEPPPETPDETTSGGNSTDNDATGGVAPRPICTGSNVGGYFGVADEIGLPLCVDGACNPEMGLLSCDCQTFTVTAGTIERLPDFVIEPPPECEDGIDNDEDGLVDQLDPGCQQGDAEGTPVLSPEIELSLSILSGNPNAACRNIRVGQLALSIDGNDVSPIPCSAGRTRFTTPLAVGPHELSITGITGLEPVTVAKTVEFEVTELGVTEPAVLDVDFADVDLLEPLETSIRFSYLLSPPDPDAEPALCSDDAVQATDFRLRLLDSGLEPIVPAPLTSAGFRLNGSSTECTAAIITTADVFRWGGYRLEFEAFNASGDLCWSNAGNPDPLVPAGTLELVVEPAVDAPASCFGG